MYKAVNIKTGIMILCLLMALSPSSKAADGNWGLSFHENGKPPSGNATSEYLTQYDAFYIGNSEKKIIYLTFDAGYENGYTASILDTLKQHNVPAAFFLVGNYL